MSDVRWKIPVEGDIRRRRVTVDFAAAGFPSGFTVSKAWLTVKAEAGDTDAQALVQKEITTTNVDGTGHIEVDGTGGADIVLRFDLEPADTLAIGTLDDAERGRLFDIQFLGSDGYPYTPESGRVWCQHANITVATS